MAQEFWNSYPASVIRWALVAHWLNTNGYADYRLQDLKLPENLFTPPEPSDLSLSGSIKSVFPSFSLKELETSLETLIGYDNKRRSGTVLTPSFIIDYLVKTAIRFYSEGSQNVPLICDPACGYAGFLISAIQLLDSVYSISPCEAIRRYIYGYDISPDTIAIAKTMLALSVLNLGHDPKELEFNLRCVDTLLYDPADLGKPRNHFSGFDVLVTNPPYIKLQNLPFDYRARLQEKYPEYSTGSFSTAMLFLIAGHRLLSTKGCLGYITQNNLFTSLAGRQVRKFLTDNECIRRIIDFGSSKIFENASAYTCLLFVTSKRTKSFQYGRLVKDVNSLSLLDLKYSTVPHSSLNPSKWRLVPSEHQNNTRMLESIGTPLGALFTLRVGFATLKDRVYFVRTSGSSVIGKTADGREYQIEPEITRPAIKIAEFNSQNELHSNSRRIIFPYEKANGKYRPINELSLATRFPNCYAYLMSWKEDLATRDKGKQPIEPWYGWGRTQGMDAPGPKLLTKTFSNHPNFMLDESDSLFCNGYGVFAKDSSATLFAPVYSLRVMQAIINSAVMDYYLRLTSFQIEGDYQCYQKNFIERLSIPLLDEKEMRLILDLQGNERDLFLCDKYKLDYTEVCNLLSERS